MISEKNLLAGPSAPRGFRLQAWSQRSRIGVSLENVSSTKEVNQEGGAGLRLKVVRQRASAPEVLHFHPRLGLPCALEDSVVNRQFGLGELLLKLETRNSKLLEALRDIQELCDIPNPIPTQNLGYPKIPFGISQNEFAIILGSHLVSPLDFGITDFLTSFFWE